MADSPLQTEVQFLKGVGPRVAPRLAKLGVYTVRDLLLVLPRRYEDRRHLPPIAHARVGQFVTVRGKLVRFEVRTSRGGQVILRGIVRDGSGSIAVTWFNQPWVRNALESYRGDFVAYGQVKEGSSGLEISGPEWEVIEDEADLEDFAKIVPVYPLTEGLYQKTMRTAVRNALALSLAHVRETLPKVFRAQHDLPDLKWALQNIHGPTSEEDRVRARHRLVFDEFFYLQLGLGLKRLETNAELGISFPISHLIRDGSMPSQADGDSPNKSRKAAVRRVKRTYSHLFQEDVERRHAGIPLWDQIHSMLPFELTGAQNRVIGEIFADMERPHPMNRLLQGDVGSGKTAVAACAILAAVRCGYQAALMAPTEILAEQHGVNLRGLLEPAGLEVEVVVGKLSATQKRRAGERIASGRSHVIVGTHALIQEGISFARLGLAVVDEQHRFGVLQRKALRDKGIGNPDVLVMTATPIPRTLTMTVYGDLDVSVVDELPPGRKPVKTHFKPASLRDTVYTGVRELLDEGRQAYFVCPMVSDNEKVQAQAAEDLHLRLTTQVYPDLRVGLLHGQLKPKAKEAVMNAFRAHLIDILVSTTVIEVGVDVPNASVMVIEDANRFGLSQLHQLRGRVGRGQFQSYCILVADPKTEDARTRMEVMVRTNNGFEIAEEDLRLRGPGDMVGTRQSGNADFRVADLVQDGRLLEVTRQAAIDVLDTDPKLEDPKWERVRERLLEIRQDTAMITIS